ncbi:MAG: hypothetical protein HQL10_04920 [Nitrospirae bacterium]|nr:hypothetical protein [Nitrospirota bacterium]
MSKFLQGNYEMAQDSQASEVKKTEQGYSEMFEKQALERLGGSIAFVMKADKFVWDDEEDA